MKLLLALSLILCQGVYLLNPALALDSTSSGQVQVSNPLRAEKMAPPPLYPMIAQVQGQIKVASAVNTPEAILKRLMVANEIPPEVNPVLQVERSDNLNAATDGKNLIITDTLLNKLATEDERAFVISHELAHILLSHISKTQIRRTGLSLLDFLIGRKAGTNSLLATASRMGINLVDLKSSRGYEYQADDLGIQLMRKAGYNPQAAIRVFDVLEANTPTNNAPGFLLSHPISRNRIEALVKKYQLTLQ